MKLKQKLSDITSLFVFVLAIIFMAASIICSKVKDASKFTFSIFAKVLRKIKYYAQLLDGVWSVPLGFLAFFFVGLLLSTVFGMAVGQYDLAFIQPLFLAGTVVVGATNMAVLGLYFTFRGVYRYLYGHRDKNGAVHNASKIDFIESITPIQRLWLAFLLFFFFVVCILIVYLSLV